MRRDQSGSGAVRMFDKPCFGCPFTKDSIVSPARTRSIAEDCRARDVHFECHKSAHGMVPSGVICAGYYRSVFLKSQSGNLVRVLERLGGIPTEPCPPDVDAHARETMMPWRLQPRAKRGG